MRWAVVILGCLGFAGATQAAERWPEGPCRDVQQQESYLVNRPHLVQFLILKPETAFILK